MKLLRNILMMIVVSAFAACTSDPQWADPEAHERTEQLREQYAPIIVGTWHIEQLTDKQRFFEQLTFQPDGTLTGLRKWQSRQLITIDGEQRYTDWEDKEQLTGTFTGSWSLLWDRDQQGTGSNRLMLTATFDSLQSDYYAYSHNLSFVSADATMLRFNGLGFHTADGVTTYLRGEAEPSF